jgi:hypothetical protein
VHSSQNIADCNIVAHLPTLFAIESSGFEIFGVSRPSKIDSNLSKNAFTVAQVAPIRSPQELLESELGD